MSSLLSQIETIVKTVQLTQQDVLEATECIIQEYLNQQRKLFDKDDERNEQTIDVECDKDGYYIDKDGYIYDINSHIRIGKKDLKTNEKVMYNVV